MVAAQTVVFGCGNILLGDDGFGPAVIEALYIGNYSSELFEGQGHTAPIMADWIGLTPRPATRIEDACASSGVALRQGIVAVASGLYDVVLVGGIEKMSNLPTAQVTDALARACGLDAGFGRGTRGWDVASFLVKALRARA